MSGLASISLIVLVLVFALVFVAAVLRRRTSGGVPHREVVIEYLRKSPMTPTEVRFFHRLVEALPEAVVAPQVSMAAMVDIPASMKAGKFRHVNRAKFAQQRLDYVLFERISGQPVCVIELDDRTHDTGEQKAKDAERDAILSGVGYEVVRFDARKMPSVSELRAALT